MSVQRVSGDGVVSSWWLNYDLINMKLININDISIFLNEFCILFHTDEIHINNQTGILI